MGSTTSLVPPESPYSFMSPGQGAPQKAGITDFGSNAAGRCLQLAVAGQTGP
jgi:hypothetical protein